MERIEIISEFKKYYGANADFRDGQLDAIEAAVSEKRILVVQKTGWGKSLVYFLAAKLLRMQGKGITLIVSPLLVLMNNQIEAANKLNLNVRTINSQNHDAWENVYAEMVADELDALIISPERLSNNEFREQLSQINNISMLVIDEAHCISDWGHDFRPDYRRIVSIVEAMPKNASLIATTATANDRVVSDVKKQLGEDILVFRGPLMRETLNIQTIKMETVVERLAWLKENIPYCKGSGIVYCLTINDCECVAQWLNLNGIKCEAYHSKIENEKKQAIVGKFLKNEVKVLSATVAFGMGFDKPDIGFVIHFQKPKDVVSYYQQIGRAGREKNQMADVVLLYGENDDEINEYFIDAAFPTEKLMIDITGTLTKHPGLTLSQLESYVNAKKSKIEACLKYLSVEGAIYSKKENAIKYYRTLRIWHPDKKTIDRITTIRRNELQQMNEFAKLSSCYMKFLAEALDDKNACNCNHCSNCLGHDFYPRNASNKDIHSAEIFLKNGFNVLSARKQYPNGKRIPVELLCSDIVVLSSYADAGWGKMVSNGKYKDGFFSDELVDASADVLREVVKKQGITWVTYIDSRRRPELVKGFAERLACKLGLRMKKAIIKKDNNSLQQKKCENSVHQFNNVNNSFEVDIEEVVFGGNVLVVDDMVDSKWTFTVCGEKLRRAGCGTVTPFALANTAGRN